MVRRGIVTKGISGKFFVQVDGQLIECYARKKLKKEDSIVLAGDMVDVDTSECVIENIVPRKNMLIRPPIANIDRIIIVISCIPEADLYLIDKLIIAAKLNKIEPILCFNKIDINNDYADEIEQQYLKSKSKFIKVSAKTGYNIDKLIEIMQGGVNCFAGQSAVGKSSLINAILGCNYSQTGDLSEKILRGKNTTRHTELIPVKDFFIADTPGFSLLELENLKYNELKDYYDEFLPYKSDCRFSSCTHTKEPDCAVLNAVSKGEISSSRHKRYTEMYFELKENQSFN